MIIILCDLFPNLPSGVEFVNFDNGDWLMDKSIKFDWWLLFIRPLFQIDNTHCIQIHFEKKQKKQSTTHCVRVMTFLPYYNYCEISNISRTLNPTT